MRPELGRDSFTRHGWQRYSGRGLRKADIQAALRYGRHSYSGGCEQFFLGQREVERARQRGIDLSRHKGVHVVVDSEGIVVTTFRNQSYRRPKPYRRASRAKQ